MFAVVSVQTPETHLSVHDSGADAAKAARELTAKTGGQYRVLPIKRDTGDATWKAREQARFDSGVYTAAPWAGEPWALQDHFVHISTDDPEQIAYTQNAEHGAADRQTRIRSGKYLTRYHSEILSQDQIREWCAKLAAPRRGLRFANTPDEIENVYVNGPGFGSCMRYDAGYFVSARHPVRVYGAGDLAIAYAVDGDEICARAICWPTKKRYGRIYGDENLLTTLLDIAGFTDNGNFDGARLLRIEDDDSFTMPYLDSPNSNATDNGEYLIIDSDGEIGCQQTNGLADVGGRYVCANCEERCNDIYIVDDEEWCESCYQDYSWCCDDCTQNFSGNSYLSTHNGLNICENCADSYTTCEECDDCFATEDMEHSSVADAYYCTRCARDMERTHCGEIAKDIEDCSCAECERARDEQGTENVEPTTDAVCLKPTSPRIEDYRQLETSLSRSC